MKRNLLVFCLAISIISSTNFSAKGQNWMVGVPINQLLTSVGAYTGGCSPAADFRFTFLGPNVSGVNFYLVPTVLPNNNCVIQPINDTLALGDTIPYIIGTNTYHIYNTSGAGGQVVMEIRAIGTPTTAGQPHPCTVSPFWISNLMLCPEGLQNNYQNNCSVQPFVGLSEAPVSAFNIIYPATSNNQLLQVTGAFANLSVTDITGRIVFQSGAEGNVEFNMQHLPAGIYNLVIAGGEKTYGHKFALQH